MSYALFRMELSDCVLVKRGGTYGARVLGLGGSRTLPHPATESRPILGGWSGNRGSRKSFLQA